MTDARFSRNFTALARNLIKTTVCDGIGVIRCFESVAVIATNLKIGNDSDRDFIAGRGARSRPSLEQGRKPVPIAFKFQDDPGKNEQRSTSSIKILRPPLVYALCGSMITGIGNFKFFCLLLSLKHTDCTLLILAG